MDKVLPRIKSWWTWAFHQPLVLINITLIIVAVVFFAHLLTKPIDVLQNWTVQTTKKEVNGKLPVYNPGGTLEFISTSVKLQSAEGMTTRIFDCDATANQPAREIQLDPIPANRAPGVNPPRENSIVVPAVGQFNGLPRTCRLVFNTCYDDVILWRDHCEQARSNDFLVEEAKLNAEAIQKEIHDLKERIKELEGLAKASTNSTVVFTPTPVSQPTKESSTPPKESKPDNDSDNNGGENTPPPAPAVTCALGLPVQGTFLLGGLLCR